MTQFIVEKISESLTRITLDTRKIILVGTAHVSAESLEDVKKSIDEMHPDHVCVELDEQRLKKLEDGQTWSGTDIKNVIRRGQGFMLMANLALSSFQRRMSADTGISPGEEMKTAVEACRAKGLSFTCADRPVQTTLSRAWKMSSLWSKLKLLSALIASVLSRESSSAEEIENLKRTDVMQGMMKELADYLPSVKSILIDERDHYLAARIFDAPGKTIVAVVGAAHVPGIIDTLEKIAQQELGTDTRELDTIPPRKWPVKILPWLIPAAIAGLFIFGLIRSGLQKSLEMGLVWVLANGVLASIGALAALAHPLTIISSFLCAPLTSLNPTIGVGMVAGLLEYFFRPPRVLDMENLNADITSLNGWYRNRVTRILLVLFLSSLGSSIGTFAAIPLLTRIVGGA